MEPVSYRFLIGHRFAAWSWTSLPNRYSYTFPPSRLFVFNTFPFYIRL